MNIKRLQQLAGIKTINEIKVNIPNSFPEGKFIKITNQEELKELIKSKKARKKTRHGNTWDTTKPIDFNKSPFYQEPFRFPFTIWNHKGVIDYSMDEDED